MKKLKPERRKIRRIDIYTVDDTFAKRAAIPEIDMLRYDSAYASDKYPTMVAFINGRKPTTGRWDSFGQKLTPVGQASFIEPSIWYTYGDIQQKFVKVLMSDEKGIFGCDLIWEFKCSSMFTEYR